MPESQPQQLEIIVEAIRAAHGEWISLAEIRRENQIGELTKVALMGLELLVRQAKIEHQLSSQGRLYRWVGWDD